MKTNISRRRLIQSGATMGAAGLLNFGAAASGFAELLDQGTPALTPEEVAAIDQAIGKKGAYNEGQTTHFHAFPRNDLKVTVKGEPVPIALGFGGWAAFRRTLDGESAILMSDNVLLAEEVNPLIDAALANGLEVGAIHNHFFFEEPRIFYMHLHGMGGLTDLAQRYAKTIAGTKIAPANQPKAGAQGKGAREIFKVGAMDKIMGRTGTANGPVYKYTVGRADLRVREMGAELTPTIGLNSWCSFAGTPEAALATGDLAMLAHEVNVVIKVLRGAGFEVCALHSHMLTEQPRIHFLHFLGRGPAEELVRVFRSAVDILGKVKPGMHMGI